MVSPRRELSHAYCEGSLQVVEQYLQDLVQQFEPGRRGLACEPGGVGVLQARHSGLGDPVRDAGEDGVHGGHEEIGRLVIQEPAQGSVAVGAINFHQGNGFHLPMG